MTTTRRILILAVFAAFCAAAATSTDALLALAPGDATILTGFNVDQAKLSPFGMYMLGQVQISDPEFQKFISDTGFDPRRDLSLLITATSGDSTTNHTVILGRGTFNAGKITNVATSMGAKVVNYKGVDMLEHANADFTGALAFLDATTAVIGEEDAVKAVIDRRGSATPVLPAATVKTIQTLAAANDAWFLSTVSPASFFSGKIDNPQLGSMVEAGLIQAVLSGNGGLKFNAKGAAITGQAMTRSDKDAQALADVFKFMINILQSNRGSSPQMGQFAAMLDSAQISAQGPVTTLSLMIPEATLEQLFMGKKGGQGRQRAAAAGRGRK